MNITQIEEWAKREVAIDGWVKLSSAASLQSLALAKRYGGHRMVLRIHRLIKRANTMAKELEFMHNCPALYNAERYDAILQHLMRCLRSIIKPARLAEADAMYYVKRKAECEAKLKAQREASEAAFEEVYG